MYGYIYKTTNTNNCATYIGKKKGEFNPNYYGSGVRIRNAVTKYGKTAFKVEMICTAVNKEALNILEKKYIAEYKHILGRDKCYNIAEGGDGGDTGADNKGIKNGMFGKKGKDNPNWVPKISVTCRNCNKTLEISPCFVKDATHHFCSKECFKQYKCSCMWMYKNDVCKYIHKEEMPKYIDLGWALGRGVVSKNSGFRSANKHWQDRKKNGMSGLVGELHHNFGKHIHSTDEARKKCGAANIGRIPWNKGKSKYAIKPE